MATCFSCGKEFILQEKVGRRDTCSGCDAEIHCCFNCEFYDEHAYNECREPLADRVLDKERANFCDFFQLGKQSRHRLKKRDEVAEAKKKLEELFRKR
ncbi:MAG: hypothetical protein HYW02_01495 [Deltaproteobacteria bacterium]|nr:hypothetical protein [Deltaproteobacteria bacterium]